VRHLEVLFVYKSLVPSLLTRLFSQDQGHIGSEKDAELVSEFDEEGTEVVW
jgi:hypothetical protein